MVYRENMRCICFIYYFSPVGQVPCAPGTKILSCVKSLLFPVRGILVTDADKSKNS